MSPICDNRPLRVNAFSTGWVFASTGCVFDACRLTSRGRQWSTSFPWSSYTLVVSGTREALTVRRIQYVTMDSMHMKLSL